MVDSPIDDDLDLRKVCSLTDDELRKVCDARKILTVDEGAYKDFHYERDRLRAERDGLRAELEATKKAKRENDDRFMTERDQARQEARAAQALLDCYRQTKAFWPLSLRAAIDNYDLPKVVELTKQHDAVVAQWKADSDALADIKAKIAWDRDPTKRVPDVPVTQVRYDELLRERERLRGLLKPLRLLARTAADRATDIDLLIEEELNDEEESDEDETMNMSVDELELSVRIANVLERRGVKTVEDLISFSREDLIKEGCRPKQIDELEQELADLGVHLRRETLDLRCPACGSSSPHLHPALQHEGEVQLCEHPWHASTEEGRARLANFLNKGEPFNAAHVYDTDRYIAGIGCVAHKVHRDYTAISKRDLRCLMDAVALHTGTKGFIAEIDALNAEANDGVRFEAGAYKDYLRFVDLRSQIEKTALEVLAKKDDLLR